MSDKIEACECGRVPTRRRTDLPAGIGKWFRICSARCWVGPTCNTPEEADAAWNEVMRAVRMMRRLREPIGEPKDNGIDLTHLPKGKPTAYSEGGPAR